MIYLAGTIPSSRARSCENERRKERNRRAELKRKQAKYPRCGRSRAFGCSVRPRCLFCSSSSSSAAAAAVHRAGPKFSPRGQHSFDGRSRCRDLGRGLGRSWASDKRRQARRRRSRREQKCRGRRGGDNSDAGQIRVLLLAIEFALPHPPGGDSIEFCLPEFWPVSNYRCHMYIMLKELYYGLKIWPESWPHVRPEIFVVH